MSVMECSELREVAPELALGTLPGDERAAAIIHLARCGECQLRVEELSDAADSILLLGPEADPPRGFSRRVVAGMQPASPRRRRRVAAVVAIGVVTAVLGIGVMTDTVRHSSSPPFALHGRGVHMAELVAAEGEHVHGQVFVDADSPSWVFMTVRDTDSESGETYTCQLVTAGGSVVDVGSFQLHGGAGSWGRAIEINAGAFRRVRLVDSSGQTAATASLT